MIRLVLKRSLIPLFALAPLVMGCTKEDAKSDVVPGLRIVQEGMGGNGSKVWVSNTDKTQNGWVPYSYLVLEKIRIQGSNFGTKEIMKSEGGGFYIDYTPIGNFSACYPMAMYSTSSTSETVIIKNVPFNNILNYPQDGDYSGKMVTQFPMVAFGTASTTQLKFKHVTGAIAFDLVNNTGSDIVFSNGNGGVYSIMVTAKNDSNNVVNLWATQNNDNFTCTSDGSGGINVTNNPGANATNSTTFYLNKGMMTSKSQCLYNMDKDEIIHVVLPIPETTATKFEISIYKASQSGSNYIQGKVIKSRTTPLMTIERNTIYNLGPFYLK